MMGVSPTFPTTLEQLGTKVYLIWAGLVIGVAFLATPAKFLAPSLSLNVALEVGRHTFGVYNKVELVIVVGLLIFGAAAPQRGRWYLNLLGPAAVVVLQALWLIPALDLRVSLIQAGQTPAPSNLHSVYIVVEALKVLWLLAVGWGGTLSAVPARPGRLGRRVKSSGSVLAHRKV